MKVDMTDIIAVAGNSQAERLAQELRTAGMEAVVCEAQGPQGMYIVAVDGSRLAEARDIVAAVQSCECHQEGNRDEAEPGPPHRRRASRRGFVE